MSQDYGQRHVQGPSRIKAGQVFSDSLTTYLAISDSDERVVRSFVLVSVWPFLRRGIVVVSTSVITEVHT